MFERVEEQEPRLSRSWGSDSGVLLVGCEGSWRIWGRGAPAVLALSVELELRRLGVCHGRAFALVAGKGVRRIKTAMEVRRKLIVML